MSTKKRTYSARDYEDMVKIEIENAIEETKKRIEDLNQEMRKVCKKPENVIEILDGELALRGIQIASDVRREFLLNGYRYNQHLDREELKDDFKPKYNHVTLFLDNLRDIKSDDAKKLVKHIFAYFSTVPRFEKKIDPLVDRRKVLENKMESYRSIAARFRLGYTGDPTDLNSINHKCKQFVLEGKAP